jgi:hypothetical protein
MMAVESNVATIQCGQRAKRRKDSNLAMMEIGALMRLQVGFTTSGFLPPRTSQSLACPSASPRRLPQIRLRGEIYLHPSLS